MNKYPFIYKSFSCQTTENECSDDAKIFTLRMAADDISCVPLWSITQDKSID